MGWPIFACCLSFLAGLPRRRGCRAGLPWPLFHTGTARLWRAWWRHKSRRRGGRPPTERSLIALIRRMSAENPHWGAPRIHGELIKLGFKIAQSTVARYMMPRDHRPIPGWATFLRNEAKAIKAIDMLSVPTLRFGRLYAFVVLGLGRRAILHVEVTDHPTAHWLASQIAAAFPDCSRPTRLIRDNDRVYGAVFRAELVAMGIRDRPITPYSPWQNGYEERVIGSIRRECLDHAIIVNAAHLRRLLAAYVDYYNADRTLLSLAKDLRSGRPIEATGPIVSRRVLGDLHHRYSRKGSE